MSSRIFSSILSMTLRWVRAGNRLSAVSIMLPALIPSASKCVASSTISSRAFSLMREAVRVAWSRSSRYFFSPLAEGGCNRLVLPLLRESTYGPVVARESMNLGLYQSKISLVGIILPVLLKMSCRARCFLYETLQVLGNALASVWGKEMREPFAGYL